MSFKIKESPIIETNPGCFSCLCVWKKNRVHSASDEKNTSVEEKTDTIRSKNIPLLDFSKLPSRGSIYILENKELNWAVALEID